MPIYFSWFITALLFGKWWSQTITTYRKVGAFYIACNRDFFANLLLRRLLTRLRFSDKAGNHNLSSANGYDIVGSDLRSTDDLGRSEVVPSGTQRREGKSSDCVRLCHGYWRLVWANESLNCHLGHRFTRVRKPNPALEWISHRFAIF